MNADAGEKPIRKHVIFHGRVQGVCFRAVSARLTEEFRVVGYVRNLADGTVELEAQGVAGEVEGLLAAIGREFKGNIRKADASEIPLAGGEEEFRIAY
jgi:acylphosphatase